MTEKELRKQILELVGEYCKNFHLKEKEFEEGDRISYGGRKFDSEEMINLVDSSLDFWLTSGRYCDQFEKEFAEILDVKYVSLVNSGSSANLIAFMTLTAPELKERRINRGDEVITVACGFPTTIAPVIQYGAIPVFLDVTLPTYNIDVTQLEKALSPKTKAVIVAHSLGNPFNIKAVKEFCDKNNLWLIEDNCDALGSTYTIDSETRLTGTWGDIGTSSFYPPHHLTMGEGGAVYTNNSLLNKLIRSYRDWGRDCMCASGQDNLCQHRFTRQFGELPLGYDHKYTYSHFGYNVKVTEMQAAIGCAQIKKLDKFTEMRRNNFNYLKENLRCLEDKLILPEATENSNPSWFGFLITVKEGVNRKELVEHIEKHNIQTRALFAGNIIKHPCFDDIRETNSYRVVSNLENSNRILNDTFWIGVYPGMTTEKLDYMIKIIKQYW